MSSHGCRLLSLPVVAILVAGCASPHPERLAADVDRYLHAMQAWARVEVETGRAIERILATQFVDDAEVLRQLADSRPRVQRHLHELRAYRPDTVDVRAVHRQYIDAWTELLTGYGELTSGLRNVDAAALAEGRQALIAWRRSLRTVAADLRDLSEISRATTQKREGPT